MTSPALNWATRSFTPRWELGSSSEPDHNNKCLLLAHRCIRCGAIFWTLLDKSGHWSARAHIANSGSFPAQSLKQGTKRQISTTSSCDYADYGPTNFMSGPMLPLSAAFSAVMYASRRLFIV